MPLSVLSPAKTLDETVICDVKLTEAPLASERKKLLAVCSKLSQADLKKLMSLSDSLAKLNYTRFQKFDKQERKAACWAFDGPAHKALDIASLTAGQRKYAQNTIVTLSGLYGCLRPQDAIQPYRLEMGCKLQTDRGKTLYDFWGGRVAEELGRRLKKMPAAQRFVVNVASQEYWQVLAKHADSLGAQIYTINFPGPSVFAKEARGLFCRFMCQRGVTAPKQLRDFAEWTVQQGGAVYKLTGQTETTLTFARTGSAAPAAGAKKRKRGD